MLIKVVIVILFIGIIVSLSSALVFLMKDVGNSKRRTLYALGIRVSLAVLLLLTISWGVYSGQLGSKAPWDKKLHPERLIPATTKP